MKKNLSYTLNFHTHFSSKPNPLIDTPFPLFAPSPLVLHYILVPKRNLLLISL